MIINKEISICCGTENKRFVRTALLTPKRRQGKESLALKAFFVKCLGCDLRGPLADTKLQAINSWNNDFRFPLDEWAALYPRYSEENNDYQ